MDCFYVHTQDLKCDMMGLINSLEVLWLLGHESYLQFVLLSDLKKALEKSGYLKNAKYNALFI